MPSPSKDNKTLPDTIGGKHVPKSVKDDYKEAIKHSSQKSQPIVFTPRTYKPQRIPEYNVDVTKDGPIFRSGTFTRGQTADSLIKFIYGAEKTGDERCAACIKGNGLFKAYVVLTDMNEGCANCHYSNAANKCSLHKDYNPAAHVSPRKRKTSFESDHSDTILDNSDEALLAQIKLIPKNTCKILANLFQSLSK